MDCAGRDDMHDPLPTQSDQSIVKRQRSRVLRVIKHAKHACDITQSTAHAAAFFLGSRMTDGTRPTHEDLKLALTYANARVGESRNIEVIFLLLSLLAGEEQDRFFWSDQRMLAADAGDSVTQAAVRHVSATGSCGISIAKQSV
jgi:hypothetical protein